MALTREAIGFGDEGRHALETFIAELGDLATDGAHEVFVMRGVARGLEAAKAFTEIAFDREPAFHQQIERAVDRRQTGRCSPSFELRRDIIGGKMSRRLEDDVGDSEALRGNGEPVFAQVRIEVVAYADVAHEGWAMTCRSSSPEKCSGSDSSPARRATPRATRSTVASGASAS